MKEPFLRSFLKLENGVPSHDTFSRLFRNLDPEKFRASFQRFMAKFSEHCQGVWEGFASLIRIERRDVKHRALGTQNIPAAAWVDNIESAVAVVDKQPLHVEMKLGG